MKDSQRTVTSSSASLRMSFRAPGKEADFAAKWLADQLRSAGWTASEAITTHQLFASIWHKKGAQGIEVQLYLSVVQLDKAAHYFSAIDVVGSPLDEASGAATKHR